MRTGTATVANFNTEGWRKWKVSMELIVGTTPSVLVGFDGRGKVCRLSSRSRFSELQHRNFVIQKSGLGIH
jgi:hypothetical protein